MRPIIVGSGLAGLVAALEIARDQDCLLLTAGALTGGAASQWAQGGIAAALDADDSPALHAQETWHAGAEVGDPATINRITAAAPEVVQMLTALGVPFDRTASGAYDLALEGGHSRHRVAHAGDRSGAAITQAVAQHVADHPRIEVLERHRALEILVTDGRVRGIRVNGPDGRYDLAASAVVLATGGLGALFLHTTNPLSAIGSGVALAARAGARTDDLHLVQFHPTALDIGVDPAPLLTEALRGGGAALRTGGARFVDELQPRDVVAAAVWEQLRAGRQVVLDASAVRRAEDRFPAVTSLLAPHGLSLRDPLPIRPAAHYSMGGVTVDSAARTSVPGLYAIGEVSRTGLHGANRLASNSLLEAVVTGQVAARRIVSGASAWPSEVLAADPSLHRRADNSQVVLTRAEVRGALGQACGVLRDGDTLAAAADRLSPAVGQDDAYVAWLLARSALEHKHSVGAHRRTDEPVAQEVPA